MLVKSMKSSDLRHRITIQTMNHLGLWENVITLWSAIRPLFAKEKIERPDINQSATHLFTVRFRPDIKSTMRVIYRNKIYDIQSIGEHFQKRDRLELTCEEQHEMGDKVAVIRMKKNKGDRNLVMATAMPPREVSCCIIDIERGYKESDKEAVQWSKKAIIDFYLGEDVREGDTISLGMNGEFFVVESKQTKHFLSVVALQEKRGAE
ncbi:phage head closure protein [Brevibacillus laterosporus]|uniref:phage head closure protein n=1 Tax=Brevibacillus laterosporus TaxID=1465 RepID=UPI000E6BF3BE|nr:head-tail adaptor protein [Brevibacillus laterosporus]